MSEEQDTLLEFPCEFPIKVFGRNDDQFMGLVLDIVTRHAGTVEEERISSRTKGVWLSITVIITAQSKAQLDAIYLDLTGCDQVVMAL